MRFRSIALSLIAVALLALGGIGAVAAQDATPATDSSAAADLNITLTDAGVEGLPAETTAGWHTVSFTNSATPSGDPFEDAWGIDFVMLPEGMTLDDVAAAFAGPPPGAEGEGMEMASPESMEGMDMGSPEAGAALRIRSHSSTTPTWPVARVPSTAKPLRPRSTSSLETTRYSPSALAPRLR